MSTKLAYDPLFIDFHIVQGKWWYYTIWKWHIPLKVNFFCLLMLENKILTWDIFLKRGGNGPNVSIFCYMDEELVDQLMVHCKFTRDL